MTKKLLLVDLENRHKVDLSPLDQSFRAIIFVGANQNPPKASRKPATAHRFSRVDFLKISGTGKNALDFHIAFELGRTFETSPDTQCFVLSGDKPWIWRPAGTASGPAQLNTMGAGGVATAAGSPYHLIRSSCPPISPASLKLRRLGRTMAESLPNAAGATRRRT